MIEVHIPHSLQHMFEAALKDNNLNFDEPIDTDSFDGVSLLVYTLAVLKTNLPTISALLSSVASSLVIVRLSLSKASEAEQKDAKRIIVIHSGKRYPINSIDDFILAEE